MHATPSEVSITQINHRVIESNALKALTKNPPKKYSIKYTLRTLIIRDLIL